MVSGGGAAEATANGTPGGYVGFKIVADTDSVATLTCAIDVTNRTSVADSYAVSDEDGYGGAGFGRGWSTSNAVRVDVGVGGERLQQEVLPTDGTITATYALKWEYRVDAGETLRAGLGVWDGGLRNCAITTTGAAVTSALDTDRNHAAALTVADFSGAGAGVGALDLVAAGASAAQMTERTVSGYVAAIFDVGSFTAASASVLRATDPDGDTQIGLNNLWIAENMPGTWRFELDGTRIDTIATAPVLWLFDLPA